MQDRAAEEPELHAALDQQREVAEAPASRTRRRDAPDVALAAVLARDSRSRCRPRRRAPAPRPARWRGAPPAAGRRRARCRAATATSGPARGSPDSGPSSRARRVSAVLMLQSYPDINFYTGICDADHTAQGRRADRPIARPCDASAPRSSPPRCCSPLPAAAPAAEGDIIVQREPGLDGAERAACARDAGVKLVEALPIERTELVEPPDGDVARRSPRCAPTTTSSTPSPTARAASLARSTTRLRLLWALRTSARRIVGGLAPRTPTSTRPRRGTRSEGAGVTVGVVDTGVKPTHDATSPARIASRGYDCRRRRRTQRPSAGRQRPRHARLRHDRRAGEQQHRRRRRRAGGQGPAAARARRRAAAAA